MMERELLLGTTNPSKISRYRRFLDCYPSLTVYTPADTCGELKIPEGGDPAANAAAKAMSYAFKTNLPALGIDEALHLDFLGPHEQPGAYIKRAGGGRELTDDEMLQYYLEKIRAAPVGKRTGRFEHHLCLAYPDGMRFNGIAYDPHVFVDTPAKTYSKGAPLGALRYVPALGKQSMDLTPDEIVIRDATLCEGVRGFVSYALRL